MLRRYSWDLHEWRLGNNEMDLSGEIVYSFCMLKFTACLQNHCYAKQISFLIAQTAVIISKSYAAILSIPVLHHINRALICYFYRFFQSFADCSAMPLRHYSHHLRGKCQLLACFSEQYVSTNRKTTTIHTT